MKILTSFCLLIFFLGISATNEADKFFRQLKTDVNLIEVSNEKAYACEDNFNYLTYKDYLVNQNQICNQLQKLRAYRLEGGASVRRSFRHCSAKKSNQKLLKKAICVKTSFDEPPVVVEGDCPSDSDIVSLEEATSNKQDFCNLIDPNGVVKIGFGGSLSGKEKGCTISDWDNTPTKSLCIKRKIDDVRLVKANEDICQEEQTLLTVEEVSLRREEYCSLLPAMGMARLSGGAAIYGSGYGCKIIEDEKSQLGYALCGDDNRRKFDLFGTIIGKGLINEEEALLQAEETLFQGEEGELAAFEVTFPAEMFPHEMNMDLLPEIPVSE